MPVTDLHHIARDVHMPPTEAIQAASVLGAQGGRWGGLLSPEGVMGIIPPVGKGVSPDEEIAELLVGAKQTEMDHTTEFAPVLSSFVETVRDERDIAKPVPVAVKPTAARSPQSEPTPTQPTPTTAPDARQEELIKWTAVLEKQHAHVVRKQADLDERQALISRREQELTRLIDAAKEAVKNEPNPWKVWTVEAKERELNIKEMSMAAAAEEVRAKEAELQKKSEVVEQRARDAQELFALLEDKSQQISFKVKELRDREETLQRQERYAVMKERELAGKREQMERFQTLMAEKISKIEETRVELTAWNRDLDQRERLLQMRSTDVEETEKSLADLSVEVKQQQRVLESKISVLRHLERSAKLPDNTWNPSLSTARVLDLDSSTDISDVGKEDIVREASCSVSPTAPNVSSLPTPRPAPIDDPAADVLNSTSSSTNVYDID